MHLLIIGEICLDAFVALSPNLLLHIRRENSNNSCVCSRIVYKEVVMRSYDHVHLKMVYKSSISIEDANKTSTFSTFIKYTCLGTVNARRVEMQIVKLF